MRPTALITGGAGGIGRAIARTLAHRAWVVSLDRQLLENSSASMTLEVDVTDRAAVTDAVDRVTQERGGLDWVVCSAGIIKDQITWEMEYAEWDDVIRVNLTGGFNTARAVAPWLRKSPRGRLVFIGSINGIRGKFGQANYAASKAGLVGLTRSLALELARDHVTVNLIAPGFIETPMTMGIPDGAQQHAVARTPLGRIGRPDDVAAAVGFVCSDEAAFITGAVIPVDGGQLLGEVVA